MQKIKFFKYLKNLIDTYDHAKYLVGVEWGIVVEKKIRMKVQRE